ARIDAQHFARAKVPLQECSARMDKCQAISLQTFQNETFSAEEAGPESSCEGNTHADALGGTEKRFLLREQLAANFAQVHSNDLSRIGRGKGGSLFTGGTIL